MSFTKQTQKTTMYTITSLPAARRIIGAKGDNIKEMRRVLGNGLYVRVEATKTRAVSAKKLTDDGYVSMTCQNSNGVANTVRIFVGTSPPTNDAGDILVMVKPVMVSAWGAACVTEALRQIDAITNRRECDLTAKVTSCPGNLIKHVIGARGSGLRRAERSVGGGCYISCEDGIFIVKANSRGAALRGKIAVEKKISELVQRFRDQNKKPVASAKTTPLAANPFDILAADVDSEDEVVIEVVVDDTVQKQLSKSTLRRQRRALTAEQGVLDDPAVMFSRTQTVNEAACAGIGWTSDSSTVEDTANSTASDSAEASPLSGAWGAQTVTLGESLEDAVTRGDTFAPFVSAPAKKSARAPRDTKKIGFEILGGAAVVDETVSLTKKFSDMTNLFSIGTWADGDSDDE